MLCREGYSKNGILLLAHIEFIYHRSTIQTTGCSPFKVVYGKNPISPLDSAPPPTTHHFNGDTKERAQSIRKLQTSLGQDSQAK